MNTLQISVNMYWDTIDINIKDTKVYIKTPDKFNVVCFLEFIQEKEYDIDSWGDVCDIDTSYGFDVEIPFEDYVEFLNK